MATKRYADIPAARHLRDPSPESERNARRIKQDEAVPRPLSTGRTMRPGAEKAYRKQRAVAMLLTTVVGLSVPTLITLLVLFG